MPVFPFCIRLINDNKPSCSNLINASCCAYASPFSRAFYFIIARNTYTWSRTALAAIGLRRCYAQARKYFSFRAGGPDVAREYVYAVCTRHQHIQQVARPPNNDEPQRAVVAIAADGAPHLRGVLLLRRAARHFHFCFDIYDFASYIFACYRRECAPLAVARQAPEVNKINVASRSASRRQFRSREKSSPLQHCLRQRRYLISSRHWNTAPERIAHATTLKIRMRSATPRHILCVAGCSPCRGISGHCLFYA